MHAVIDSDEEPDSSVVLLGLLVLNIPLVGIQAKKETGLYGKIVLEFVINGVEEKFGIGGSTYLLY